jgi:hypothetical protein
MLGLISKRKYDDLYNDYEKLRETEWDSAYSLDGYRKLLNTQSKKIKELKDEITYLNSEVLRLKSEK